jgi:hypothetical protein
MLFADKYIEDLLAHTFVPTLDENFKEEPPPFHIPNLLTKANFACDKDGDSHVYSLNNIQDFLAEGFN